MHQILLGEGLISYLIISYVTLGVLDSALLPLKMVDGTGINLGRAILLFAGLVSPSALVLQRVTPTQQALFFYPVSID